MQRNNELDTKIEVTVINIYSKLSMLLVNNMTYLECSKGL